MAVMIILCLVVIASLLYRYVFKNMNYWTKRGVPQGSSFSLFYDNFWMLFKTKSIPKVAEELYNRSPGTRYCGAYIFCTPTLVLKDPELIKQITVKGFEHFTDHRPFIPPDVDKLLGKSLFNLTGQKWRDMRNTLSPSFTSSKMRSMFILMNECAENFVNHFFKKGENIMEMEMKNFFTRFSNDVIATTIFGVKVDSLTEPNNEFYTTGKEATNLTGVWKTIKFFGYIVMPRILKFFKITLFGKDVNRFFQDLVDETIKTREEQGIIRPDLIHLLMEARKGIYQKEEEIGTIDTGFATAIESNLVSGKKYSREITNEDIAGHALTFFFGGFDMVSSIMCFVSYELAVNPDIQKKLRNEIRDTYSQCGGKLTYEALLKMKYLDMVISETLRKWPNVPATDRICTKPYTIEPTSEDERPLYLDKGAVLWLPTWGFHHDPEYYPDPERFDPERFSDENKENITPYTYFPFGLGPRNCIGSRFALLKVKVVFFHLLSHFEIVPAKKTRIPLKLDKKSLGVTSEGGYWFGLKRINQ